ncbi:pentatricopeptide repeat-containing protein At5g16860-like [Apium graveolens]|uniref:pentatricopeptide repeat-containing protein At5g16860-like n=1 Tax=Apium graveolens TaxID=4045 RepID=UPI003D78BB36
MLPGETDQPIPFAEGVIHNVPVPDYQPGTANGNNQSSATIPLMDEGELESLVSLFASLPGEDFDDYMQKNSIKPSGPDVLIVALWLYTTDTKLTLRLGGWVFGILCPWVVVKKGFVECNVFVCNVLTMMYFKSGVLRDARKVFDEMCHIGVEDVVRGIRLWLCTCRVGDVKGALRLFERWGEGGVWCEGGCVWRRGKEVHGYALRSGLSQDVFVGNAIVDMNAKCELMDDVSKVTERIKVTDVVFWNAMVTGYFQVRRFEDALSMFEMIKSGEEVWY